MDQGFGGLAPDVRKPLKVLGLAIGAVVVLVVGIAFALSSGTPKSQAETICRKAAGTSAGDTYSTKVTFTKREGSAWFVKGSATRESTGVRYWECTANESRVQTFTWLS